MGHCNHSSNKNKKFIFYIFQIKRLLFDLWKRKICVLSLWKQKEKHVLFMKRNLFSQKREGQFSYWNFVELQLQRSRFFTFKTVVITPRMWLKFSRNFRNFSCQSCLKTSNNEFNLIFNFCESSYFSSISLWLIDYYLFKITTMFRKFWLNL